MTGGFFAVFDDIATLLDDAASMTKVATKKTAGILGDDLAVNAQKASNFAASREIPVLWAITKGSFINKLIILPLAFLLSYFASWAIIPILMLGGAYLAYEGAEKILEWILPHKQHKHENPDLQLTEDEILYIEKEKIKSAIKTDFILSIEIVIMALGVVLNETLTTQIIAVSVVAFLATIGVYGIVTLIVRMDDFGFHLIERAGEDKLFLKNIGLLLVRSLPKVIKALTVIGTLAMLLVAGGIYMHNIHQVHQFFDFLPSIVAELLIGLVLGAVVVGFEKVFLQLKKVIIPTKK
ncbi:DUF808 domain-containing protein [Sulfurimonas marina]|uniref:DUF808 domain-containing protein n=1 Tax=Sulfurimonas marina TaxID=2590551 RepID=A0A7M1AVT6_9BACT|nr:DUF808 domain-containing protein [Sulfurimonas marina]QOP41567.1 DUF808 domain-containing protein [Sulfurimonas marina]